MKQWIVRKLIDFCCKKAVKYELRKEILVKQEGIRFIYAVGSNIYERDKWLNRIEKLQNIIGK